MKTTKAKRKVAQRKTKQKVATKPKRSFLAMFGFVLLGVIVGMFTIQAVESRWLRSDVASGVSSSAGRTCGSQVTSADDCHLCCSASDEMAGASDSQVTLCAISCGTAFRSTDEAVVTERETAVATQQQSEEDILGYSITGDPSASGNNTLSSGSGNNGGGSSSSGGSSTSSSQRVFATEAECRANGCNNCQRRSSSSSSSGGGSNSSGSSLSSSNSGNVNLSDSRSAAQTCLQQAGGDVGDCQTCCADDIQCESYCESESTTSN